MRRAEARGSRNLCRPAPGCRGCREFRQAASDVNSREDGVFVFPFENEASSVAGCAIDAEHITEFDLSGGEQIRQRIN